MIALHFAAFLFTKEPGIWGILAVVMGLVSLAWGGTLFMWASVPSREEDSSRWMLAALLGSIGLYIPLLVAGPAQSWALNLAASLFGLLPLAVALTAMRNFEPSQRWIECDSVLSALDLPA
jgi:NhaP-type Na+/H+ or K+/H+ antiporter